MQQKPKIEAITGTLVSSPPRWQLNLVRILQLVGIVAGFLGGAEFLQLSAILPPDLASWLFVAGPAFAAASKPLILLVGDILDDGERNDSFKIPIAFFFIGVFSLTASTVLHSCANMPPGLSFGISPDGCALASYTDPQTGQQFKAGSCLDAEGKFSTYVTEWQTPEGVSVRAIRPIGGKETIFRYKDPSGQWLDWSSKAGLSIGKPPATVQVLILPTK